MPGSQLNYVHADSTAFGFYIHGILQNPFKHRGRGGDDDRREGNEDPHENPRRPVLTVAKHNEDCSYRNKTDNGYRAIFYSPRAFTVACENVLFCLTYPNTLNA